MSMPGTLAISSMLAHGIGVLDLDDDHDLRGWPAQIVLEIESVALCSRQADARGSPAADTLLPSRLALRSRGR